MSDKVRTSERVHQYAPNDLSGDLSAEGSLSAMPPEFSLGASALGAPDPAPPPVDGDGNGGDLTGKRSLIRTDTTLYTGMDYAKPLCRIHRNTEIMVVQDCVRDDWAKIRVEGGESGYVNRNYILQRPEGIDPGTRLHRVQGPEYQKTEPKPLKFLSQKEGILAPRPQYLIQGGEYFAVVKNGDTLEQLIQAHYPERGGMDLRTMANVILFVNNPTNLPNRGIYVKNDGMMGKWMQGIGYNYPDIVIKAGHDILMPSWARVLELRDKVKSGSISLGMVQEIWPDGWGCAIEFKAGATFVVLAGEVGLNAYFFRRGNHLAIHFSVNSGMGLSAGVGAGISVNKRGKRRGIGAEAGVDAEVMGENLGLVEFEIPLQAGVIANFLWNQATGLFESDDDKEQAANDFVSTFDDDPAIYVSKAVVQMGTRAQVTGMAGVTVMNTGDNAKTSDLGKNHSVSSYRASPGERKRQDEMVTQHRQTPLKDIQDILGGGKKGIQDGAMSQLGKLMRTLTGISGGAGASYAMGIEYGHTKSGEDKVSLFLEGAAWASFGLPALPAFTAEAGIGGRMVYVKNKRLGMWLPANREMYAFGGDLDNYTASAWELNVELDEVADAGDEVDRMIAYLQKMKFTKRFMVSLAGPRLSRRLRKMGFARSLASSNSALHSAIANAAVTVEMNLANLNPKNQKLRNAIENVQQGGTNLDSSPLVVAKTAISSVLEEGGDSQYLGLMKQFVLGDSVSKCTLHLEVGYGAAISGKVADGAKLQIDLGGSFALMYEKEFSGEEVFAAVQGAIGGDNPQNGGTGGSEKSNFQPENIADALNSNADAMEDLTLKLMGGSD